MKKIMALLVGLLIAGTALAQVKVVYHLSEGIPQASRAIGNIRNHLAADPSAKIVVVAHGAGIGRARDAIRVENLQQGRVDIGRGKEQPGQEGRPFGAVGRREHLRQIPLRHGAQFRSFAVDKAHNA